VVFIADTVRCSAFVKLSRTLRQPCNAHSAD
jgi:hypothetical protein